MLKNKLFEECVANIPPAINEEVDLSFAIADRIHYLLESQGKTQKDLAKALGKRESEISKWMRGTHNFTIETIAKIAAVLNEPIIEVKKECNLEVLKYGILIAKKDRSRYMDSGKYFYKNSSNCNNVA